MPVLPQGRGKRKRLVWVVCASIMKTLKFKGRGGKVRGREGRGIEC